MEKDPPDNFRELSIFPTLRDIQEKNPFLRKNIISGGYRDLDTYLDVQFRLLREDFVRPLRRGIETLKEGLKLGIGKVQNEDIRVYHEARVLFPEIAPTLQGITHQIQFSLEELRNIRWENSKRLIFGSLVCLSYDNFQSLLFATIANRDQLAEGRIDVFFHNANSEDLAVQKTYVMVESSSYFEAYRYVLRSLQQISEDDMSFQRYIVGERGGGFNPFDDEEDVSNPVIPDPPRYLESRTTFDLTPLMRSDCKSLGKEVVVRSNQWPAEDTIDLDKSQLDAVRNALTSEVALVQGPPGTGKTYIGLKIAETLLLNKDVWNKDKSPILVVCYTNHALDQFLEGILDFANIVRVGSRSKNEALATFSLSNLRSNMRKERSVPSDIWGTIEEIKSTMNYIQCDLSRLRVKMKAASKHVLSEVELGSVLSDDVQSLKRMQEEYNRHSRRLAEVRDQETLHILKSATVVGMTTTGAAKLHNVLKDLHPVIMIVEEAAKVLEAHIVVSLTASCQHLIMIGDHQQLRPNPTVYELGKKFNLDISLFERLIRNNLKFSRLENQHRMLPAISKLLVPHIYKELVDHESVTKYPTIRGVSSNVFFIDHEKLEKSVTDGHSKVNEHEVAFLVEMCRYLIKQGYKREQITILSTYSGQLFSFKKMMPKTEFNGVRVSTVDNYQGEENDIILLSLVRSNKEGAIGFLGIDNRVCVVLSRAKHALYCIGNFSQLCSKSGLWHNIMTYVHREKMVGDGILLQCQQHPKYEQVISL